MIGATPIGSTVRVLGLSRCLLVAVLAASVFLASDADAARPLKLGYSLPPTSHYGVGADAFAEMVSARSEGRFVIEQFPSNALGGERPMIEGLQFGTIDLVITSTGPVGNFVPETFLTDIPFLFRNYGHARAVLDGPVGQGILDAFPDHGLVALAWAENGFRHLTNNIRPIERADDLAGLTIRTMQNAVHIRAFRLFGALPTPLDWTEVLTALQQGTIDGQENPLPVILAAQLQDMQRYLSLTAHVYSPALFLMSPYVWDTLEPNDRQLFRDAAVAGSQAMRAEVDRVEAHAVATLEAAGMQVVRDVDRASFEQAMRPLHQALSDRFGGSVIARIRAAAQ